MIKFLNNNDKELIFNYLNADQSALLSGITEIYPESFIPDGVFAAQYNADIVTSLLANGESFSLLFLSKGSDCEELLYALRNEVHTPSFLPSLKPKKYYLLKSQCSVSKSEKIGKYNDFEAVLDFNRAELSVNLEYLFKKGLIIPFALENIGGGFLIKSENYNVISHVFVKEELRGNGYGTEIVKNLLNIRPEKTTYLLCEENRLQFYGRLGFTLASVVYKYNISKGNAICQNFLK